MSLAERFQAPKKPIAQFQTTGIQPITEFQSPQGVSVDPNTNPFQMGQPDIYGALELGMGLASSFQLDDPTRGANTIEDFRKADQGATMGKVGSTFGAVTAATGNPLIGGAAAAGMGLIDVFTSGQRERRALREFNDEEVERWGERSDQLKRDYFGQMDDDRLNTEMEIRQKQLGYGRR